MVTVTKDVDRFDFWTKAAIIVSQNYRDFMLHFSVLGLDLRYSALDQTKSFPIPARMETRHSANVDAFVESRLQRPKMSVTRCFRATWRLYTTNFGMLLVTTWLVLGSVAVVNFVTNLLPFGTFLANALGGILLGGLAYYYLGKLREEDRRVGDAFCGFTLAPLQLALAQMIQTIFLTLLLLPCIIGAVLIVVKNWVSEQPNTETVATPSTVPDLFGLDILSTLSGYLDSFSNYKPDLSVILLLAFVMLLSAVAALYFYISWIFTKYIIVDKGFNFWDALTISRRIVRRQWWQVLGLHLLTGLILCAGFLPALLPALILGVSEGEDLIQCALMMGGLIFFVLLPLPFSGIAVVYEVLFARKQKR
jgi:hypothetical protein